MGDEGKINGKYPIFNDILTFLWCKMKQCPRDTLLQIAKSFYKRDEIVESRDLLYENVPAGGNRRVKHRKSEEDLISMYNVLQEIETEDAPVFATMDLNNIPCVDLKNIDGVALICKQSKMEIQLQDVVHQQVAMQNQLAVITEYMKKVVQANVDETKEQNDQPKHPNRKNVSGKQQAILLSPELPLTQPTPSPPVGTTVEGLVRQETPHLDRQPRAL